MAKKERPLCPSCGEPMREIHEQIWPEKGTKNYYQNVKSVGTGKYGYAGQGYFCTLRCGYRYAVRILRGNE